MNIRTIEMNPDDAREKLRAYRAYVHRGAEKRYHDAMRGYEALAKGDGAKLVNLAEVFNDCPRDDKGRPRLAIARADRKAVEVRWDRWGHRVRFDTRIRSGQSATLALEFRFESQEMVTRGYSPVPMVPPDVYGKRDLAAHFILWEVERWSNNSGTLFPDRDPYLLRHLGGTLYAVVAEWDLTDLEIAVMQGI